ncbi:phosphoribosylanthranilate isomerase [Pararhodonellum marinum]|uniref:phosphoribosylanthranilate isomerase n=1 Tax=Pararhodonellum marinum TaxID=2755358 RepID=UPI001890219B|nr:phosphoribosylanthranilate isomerase [Pararhodonellum marinum]
MALSTFVKVGNIDNLSDARYCAGMYVNLLGFNLEENHSDYIDPEKFKEITNWLSGLDYVAEFEFAHPQNILEQLKSYPSIKWIQIQEEAHIQMLLNTSYQLIFRVVLRDSTELEALISKSQSFKDQNVIILLESEKMELDEASIPLIKELAASAPVLLGFGIHEDNVQEMIQATKAKGIALSGSKEIKPGLKDFDQLADILEVLEEGD